MKSNFNQFIFIGHRGTRVDFDENTLKAFEIAVTYGADYVELDVRKTKDKKLIIMHDSTLNRTTNGSGLVNDLTYDKIRNFRTNKKLEQIPLLSTVLNHFKENTEFLIDLKGEGICKDILRMIEKKGLMNRCIFSGRKLKELIAIKSTFPKSRICYNITKGKDLTLQEFLRMGYNEISPVKFDFFSLRSNLITKKFIELCHEHNILVLSWDFIRYKDPISKIKYLLNAGLNGILFDDYKNIPLIKQWFEKF